MEFPKNAIRISKKSRIVYPVFNFLFHMHTPAVSNLCPAQSLWKYEKINWHIYLRPTSTNKSRGTYLCTSFRKLGGCSSQVLFKLKKLVKFSRGFLTPHTHTHPHTLGFRARDNLLFRSLSGGGLQSRLIARKPRKIFSFSAISLALEINWLYLMDVFREM